VQLLLVFVGGGLGAISRHLFTMFYSNFSTEFTLLNATFWVNMLSCCFAAVVAAAISGSSNPQMKYLKSAVLVGFFGGFSTLAALDLVPIKLFATIGFTDALISNEILSLVVNVFCGIALAVIAYRTTLRIRSSLDNVSGQKLESDR
jgi:fluoride ion exporter CrcB/FEX